LLYPLSYQGSCGGSDSASDLRLLRSFPTWLKLAHQCLSLELCSPQPTADVRIDPLVRSVRSCTSAGVAWRTPPPPTSRTTSSTSSNAASHRPPTTASAPRTASPPGSRTRKTSPTHARLKPPPVPEDPVPVRDGDALRQLLEIREGRGVEKRRGAQLRSGPCVWRNVHGGFASVAGGACRQALLTSRLPG
jgi:hypothetical protein